MSPADGIRKLGFRRWYQRQLIEGHAWFVTCFLCMILAAACLEDLSLRSGGWKAVTTLALIACAGLIGVTALKRYKQLLDRAEHIAEHSTCERCAEYGRLSILSAGGSDAASALAPPWLRVQCRKCGHQWLIE
ncbi:MAG: hypothetical protein IT531_16950 [Burkholderiales bacterium]|nr:hypothetical protein [Burkholderiales bacterium]